VPITGGNVSLYNETDGNPVYPTPVIGVVGMLEHADRVLSRRFQASGDAVVLLGEGLGELGGSEFLKVLHGIVRGAPPALDLKAERALQDLLVSLAETQLIRSAHDCSDGGVAVTLAECCFDAEGMGVDVEIESVRVARDERINVAAALFGESATRVIVSAAPAVVPKVLELARAARVPARLIGRTGGDALKIAVGGRVTVEMSLRAAEEAWATALERCFARRVA
jgi:phosphoribosylformylglycinamidine synthase